jgi:hypothetical protein
MVDEESSSDNDPDVPEVIEPGSDRKGAPNWVKKYTNPPSPETTSTPVNTKTDDDLLQSAINLRNVLDAFIEKLTKKI